MESQKTVRRGRPVTINRVLVNKYLLSGYTVSEIALRCACSKQHVYRITRSIRNIVYTSDNKNTYPIEITNKASRYANVTSNSNITSGNALTMALYTAKMLKEKNDKLTSDLKRIHAEHKEAVTCYDNFIDKHNNNIILRDKEIARLAKELVEAKKTGPVSPVPPASTRSSVDINAVAYKNIKLGMYDVAEKLTDLCFSYAADLEPGEQGYIPVDAIDKVLTFINKRFQAELLADAYENWT